jgi:hypothetical protein
VNSPAQKHVERIDREYPDVREFEAGRLDPEAFDHQAHVYIAWKLLEVDTQQAATRRFTSALQQWTRKLGIEGKYHVTISCFFMALIAERRAQQTRSDWETFAGTNPDLLSNAKALLERHYSAARLYSPLARKQFLLPDGGVEKA